MGRGAHPFPPGAIAPQRTKPGGAGRHIDMRKTDGIVRRREDLPAAGPAGDLGDVADVGGEKRRPRRRRFEEHERRTLHIRGKEEQIGGVVGRHDRLPVEIGDGDAAAPEPVRGGPVRQPRPRPTAPPAATGDIIADEEQMGIAQACAAKDPQGIAVPFERGVAADMEDKKGFGGDAEPTADVDCRDGVKLISAAAVGDDDSVGQGVLAGKLGVAIDIGEMDEPVVALQEHRQPGVVVAVAGHPEHRIAARHEHLSGLKLRQHWEEEVGRPDLCRVVEDHVGFLVPYPVDVGLRVSPVARDLVAADLEADNPDAVDQSLAPGGIGRGRYGDVVAALCEPPGELPHHVLAAAARRPIRLHREEDLHRGAPGAGVLRAAARSRPRERKQRAATRSRWGSDGRFPDSFHHRR